MCFLEIPYIPDTNVSIVLIDGRIDNEIENGLKKRGIKPIKTLRHPDLYNAVAYHPDMFLHHIEGKTFVYAPNTPLKLLDELSLIGAVLIKGKTILQSKYPEDIAYNVARIGKYAVHNLKYTDEVILNELKKRDIKCLHVNQGYAKCSVLIVDEQSIITSDKTIAKVCRENGMDVLLISAEKDICLHELEYGFIGGSSGLISKNEIIVTGNKHKLQNVELIEKFARHKKKEVLSASNGIIRDVGSVIPLKY